MSAISWRSKRTANSRGQMAIFVALIFQVLFILFAMVINVALIIHDKINLQNSVDLAAYYAAQRQAEMLNVIAHENYMIRQSWKLLSWRARVPGTMAFETPPHPMFERDYSETESRAAGLSPGNDPVQCVSWDAWAETPREESVCHDRDLRIPPMPVVPVIASFFPVNIAISQLSIRLKQLADERCDETGAMNWFWTAAILHAYRLDQMNRKQVIWALADNLAKEGNDFVDLDGQSVREGAFRTFDKNLTYTNANSEGGVQFEMMNSLSGLRREDWLPDILVAPMLRFADYADAQDCLLVIKPVSGVPLERSPANSHELGPNGAIGSTIRDITKDTAGFLQDKKWQFSLGVEKNPWFVPYVGVKASTRPRQIFAPFGPVIQLQARAFAKPFGGRIGPWYGNRWPKASRASDSSVKVDLMLPERVRPDGFLQDPNSTFRQPNYSRFPGDQLGMASKLAQSAMIPFSGHSCGNGALRCQNSLSMEWYKRIIANFQEGPGQANDILAWDSDNNSGPAVRQYEVAAIAPDLFDITYYSIEPNFANNYLPKLRANRQRLGIPPDLPLRADLGSRGGVGNLEAFTVQDQIKSSAALGLRRSEAFYFVHNPTHVLTSWVPGDEAFTDYPQEPPQDRFGLCAKPDTNAKIKVPGSCLAGGGRTGYSVKLVSREVLLKTSFEDLGGQGNSDVIQNLPPEGW